MKLSKVQFTILQCMNEGEAVHYSRRRHPPAFWYGSVPGRMNWRSMDKLQTLGFVVRENEDSRGWRWVISEKGRAFLNLARGGGNTNER